MAWRQYETDWAGQPVVRNWYQGCGGKVEIPIAEGGGFDMQELDALEHSGLFVAEPKEDGIWGSIWGARAGNRVLSRNGKAKRIELPDLPIGTAIVGELSYGSQEMARRVKDRGHQFVRCFDVLFHEGRALHSHAGAERRRVLEEVCGIYPDYYQIVPRWTSQFRGHFLAEHEGLVLKPLDDGAMAFGKPEAWIKAKKRMSVDYVLMDWEVSESASWHGLCKNILCGAYVEGVLTDLVRVGVMPAQWRATFSANFGAYKGKVVEIAHFGQFASGSLRHPSFVRMREDKAAAECVFSPRADIAKDTPTVAGHTTDFLTIPIPLNTLAASRAAKVPKRGHALTGIVAHDDAGEGAWYEVPSSSVKNRIWSVTCSAGAWECTCPAYEYYPGPCKHIGAVTAMLAGVAPDDGRGVPTWRRADGHRV